MRECLVEQELMLSGLCVVHADGDFDGTVIHGFDGRDLVLAFVGRTALDDYFGWPWSVPEGRRPSVAEHRVVVDRNLAALEPIIQEKYRLGGYRYLNRCGSSLKFVEIVSTDIERGKIALTDSVIQTRRAGHFSPG
jgi:hypothetical protein